ncbi:MAG: glycosyltransferase [Capsulimonadaceae bacterium]
MAVSIVIPTYNGSKRLAATLATVAAQTYVDWNLVIIDDGSLDGTWELAQQVARTDSRIRAERQARAGVAAARNAGYAAAPATDYVIFLDHDDLWHPETLARLVEAVEAAPNAVGAHGLARIVDDAGAPVDGQVISGERRKVAGHRIVHSRPPEPTTFATLICDCCITSPGAALLRRSSVEAARDAGGHVFNPDLPPADDWDLWLRLSSRGDFAFVNDVVLDWRRHTCNASRDKHVTFMAEMRVRSAMAGCADLTDEQRRMARWRWRRVHASIERRNARAIWGWTWQNARTGKWADTLRLAVAGSRRFGLYLSLRLPLTNDRGEALPIALREQRQVLDHD